MSTQIFGRFSRVRALLVGLAAATAALGLVVLFSNPKPAEAIGETWYGTMEFQGTGEPVDSGDGGTYTSRDFHRFEAPLSSDQARVYTKVDSTLTYPAPEPGTCRIVKRQYSGSGYVTGRISVDDPGQPGEPQGFYRMAAYGDHYSGGGSTIPVTEQVTYAGRYPEGNSCARTDTFSVDWAPFGNIQSYQNPKLNYRSGESVTPALTDAGACVFYGDGYQECAEMQSNYSRGPVQARWAVARDECSGYSNAWDIGNSDRLILFNTCQTKSLSARTSWLDDITGQPEVCETTYSDVPPGVSGWSKAKVKRVLGIAKKTAVRLSRACDAYKAVRAVEWTANDWFMYNATNNDACGVWVVDGASWRPPKVTSATRNSDGQGIAWISPGQTEYVRTATGSVAVTCPG